ncbi:YceI family protein [Pseudomonas sp. SDO528_S397]
MKRRLLAAAVFALGAMSTAHAVEYTDVNPTASTLSFTFDQMGQQVYGTFGQYQASLSFDTQNPAAAKTVLTIDLKSINAGSDNANNELPKAGWFDMATYPVGTFASTRITDLGDQHYLFSGNLTIKGQTRPVDVRVALKEQSGIGVFDGEFVLKRDDYKIGAGEWASSVVSNDIRIKFKMVAPER